MQCPVCEVPLSISSREGVEIDFCPQCRGVWLDRGELDKILDRVAVAAPAAAAPSRGYEAPRYEEPRYEDRGHKKRKRRSMLDDLFDFD